MFGHQHYVPVLRVKPAELRTLRDLDPTLRPVTTPILECPPRVLRGCDTEPRLQKRAEWIVQHLAGWAGRPMFVDFSTLPSTSVAAALHAVASQMTSGHIQPVFVISLKAGPASAYGHSVRALQQQFGASLCLRLSPEELKLSNADTLIDERLQDFGVTPASTDLVLDRGGVDGGSFTFEDLAPLIPWVTAWRSLTCLAGSFPPDLAQFARGQIHRLRRWEWRQWRSLQSWAGRRPAFGDYAIQHVTFKEPVAVPNYSASIRYTIENEYVVLRGEGVLTEGGPGFGQYNGWASLLLTMPEYFGASFSAGDLYIAERASDWRSSGSAQSWLQAGLSHHITTTALQVVGLLRQARVATASAATVSNWSSIVDVGQPGAIV